MAETTPTPAAAPVTAAPQAPASTPAPTGATAPAAPSATPSATPSTAPSMSSDQLKEMITKLQTGGAPQEPAKGAAPSGQPAPGAPGAPGAPDKFKNPDGSVNIEALTKSHSDLEKSYGRLQNTDHANKQMQDQIEYLNGTIQDMQNVYEDMKSKQPTSPQQGPGLTPAEQEEHDRDPVGFMDRRMDKRWADRESKQKEVTSQQRALDFNILMEINKAKRELPGYEDLEPQIAELTGKDWLGQHPDAVPFAYHAVIGQQMPQIAESIRQSSYQEGYKAAQTDMNKHVEGGGRDTSPAVVGLGDLSGKSAEDMAKVLPRHDEGREQFK